MTSRHFIIRLSLFLIPPAAFFAFPFWVLWISGEFVSASEAVAMLRKSVPQPIVVGKVYLSFGENIKQTMYRSVRPSVTVIGNSRGLQIRQEFFNDEISFYNFADGGRALPDAFDLLRRVAFHGEEPKVVIVAVEQSAFRKADSPNSSSKNESETKKNNDILDTLVYGFRGVYSDYFQGKFSIRELLAKEHGARTIGMNALVYGGGTRRDGSYRYGNILENPSDPNLEDFAFRDTLKRVAEGTRGFEHGSTLSLDALAELELFLNDARQHGVHVVGFLPPYAPTVWRVMSESGNYAYIGKIDQAARLLFEQRGFTFFDFSDSRVFGSIDEEFIDGWHGSEKAYLRLLVVMAEHDKELATLVDARRLTKALEAASNHLEVFIP